MNDEEIPIEDMEATRPEADVFPIVRVINLARSQTRWASITQSLESAGIRNFERIDAVDASLLSKLEIERAYDADLNLKNYFSPLKPGEIACFLSHRQAWLAMVDEGLDGAFVLEDDVLFRPGAAQFMRDIANYAKSSQPLVVKIFSKRSATGRTTQISKQTRLLEPILPPLGTQGAYINRAAAEKLLLHSERFFEPVDVFLQKTWKHGVRIQVLVPNALDEVSAQLGGTTLQSGKPDNSFRMRREIMRPILRLSFFLRAFLYRFAHKYT